MLIGTLFSSYKFQRLFSNLLNLGCEGRVRTIPTTLEQFFFKALEFRPAFT